MQWITSIQSPGRKDPASQSSSAARDRRNVPDPDHPCRVRSVPLFSVWWVLLLSSRLISLWIPVRAWAFDGFIPCVTRGRRELCFHHSLTGCFLLHPHSYWNLLWHEWESKVRCIHNPTLSGRGIQSIVGTGRGLPVQPTTGRRGTGMRINQRQ
jgi:hypothetical protein